MIECLTDLEEAVVEETSCQPCPVDSPTCTPKVPNRNPNVPKTVFILRQEKE